jgi:flagellar hook protein FlgE
MLDTIFIGTSGLISHSKGLRVVGNNLANVNTPGFKSSQLQFAALVDQGTVSSHKDQSGSQTVGLGMQSTGASVNFRAGLDQTTGNPLDLNINGNGFYTVKRDDEILYTRSGDFRFDEKGILVNANGDHVMGLDAGGKLADITVDNLSRSVPKTTSTVKFRGNLNAPTTGAAADITIPNVTVFDGNGNNRPLSLTIKDNGAGEYVVTVKDAANATVATGSIKFAGGFPTAANSAISFSYAPQGVSAFTVKLDFSQGVTALTSSTSLQVESQDGYAAGVKSDQSIDADGTITVHYSNGQTAKGQRIALANFNAAADLEQAGGSSFIKRDGASVHYGFAGAEGFGTLAAGHREGSNVDLAEEFSNLILMQRGYQAASHVVSTANEMIQQLFDMKGNR